MAEQDEEHLQTAANAIEAIKKGKAASWEPFKYALLGRAAVEKWFELLARVYTTTPSTAVLLLGSIIVVFGAFCVGFVYADTSTEIIELGVRVQDRENFDYTLRFVDDPSTQEVVIQYRPNLRNSNFSNTLLDHVRLLRSIIDLPVRYNGR